MIYDSFDHITDYMGISEKLDTAIRFLVKTDLDALPEGRTDIDGDSVYVNVMRAAARPEEELRYEIHKRHMDIQIDISGTERINTGSRGYKLPVESYNPDTDFAFVSCEYRAGCILGPGNFTICMPGEPHMPGISVTSDTALKKCVVKIDIGA